MKALFTAEDRIAREMIERRRKAQRELDYHKRRLASVDTMHAKMIQEGKAITAKDIARHGYKCHDAFVTLRQSVWSSLSLSECQRRWKALRAKVSEEGVKQ